MGFKTGWGILVITVALLLPGGCRQQGAASSADAPIVRVRLLQAQDQVKLAATQPPVVRAGQSRQRLNFPTAGAEVPLTLTAQGWQIGNFSLGRSDELVIEPATAGSVRLNGMFHRGRYRFVAVGGATFDVINDVDVESYLKGVLAQEMPDRWNLEALKAQAVAARTYALYEARTSGQKSWDLYTDTRSQVYGGIPAETPKSRRAVDETAGVVLAFGERGRERIFKAYFSACCGGIGQSAVDAMGDSDLPPLRAKYVANLCNASPRFNWAPVVLSKTELTRRIRSWGERRNRPEKDMATVSRIEIAQENRFRRPTRFVVTDSRGARYSLGAEEIRWACNADANGGPILYSGFFKPVNEPDAIRFVEGHGFGHGVGLCQWCAQAMANRGHAHEDILRHSYPGAALIRAY